MKRYRVEFLEDGEIIVFERNRKDYAVRIYRQVLALGFDNVKLIDTKTGQEVEVKMWG